METELILAIVGGALFGYFVGTNIGNILGYILIELADRFGWF